MDEKKIVLVTGAAGYWGSQVAARLMMETGRTVIGLDAEQPAEEIEGLDFVQVDVRNPLLAELLKAEGVDAVCHLAFVDTNRPSEASFDLNVMGTAKVLGACADAGVRKVVLRSSMAVYGAQATNSAFLSEDHPMQASRRHGHIRDMVEIELLCNGFRRRAPEIMLTILRFPSIVGPTVNSPMTRFLKEPWAPSLLGFDPMMQIIHQHDVVAALVYAILNDVPGVYNVAAKDPLPLSKIRGLAGKPPLVVFHKLPYWAPALPGLARAPLSRCVPIEPDYIRYSWVGDLTRMHRELGFEPLYTAEETLREFAHRFRLERYQPGSASTSRAEERLHDIIEQRRRARERRASPPSGVEEAKGP
jgi:UDP-glucose 4-epimerase